MTVAAVYALASDLSSFRFKTLNLLCKGPVILMPLAPSRVVYNAAETLVNTSATKSAILFFFHRVIKRFVPLQHRVHSKLQVFFPVGFLILIRSSRGSRYGRTSVTRDNCICFSAELI